MSNPIVKIDHEVDQIEIRNGQTLTIWMNPIDPHELWEGQDRAQVEIRINNGKFEMFIDAPIEMHSFAEWVPKDILPAPEEE